MDAMQTQSSSLLLNVIPPEIHFHIVSFLNANDLMSLAQTCNELQPLADHPQFWRQAYLEAWLNGADEAFVQNTYPREFGWKKMYKKRNFVERKYLTPADAATPTSSTPTDNTSTATKSTNPAAPTPPEEEWRVYFKKGNQLCKYDTEDVEEFMTLSLIEQEEYISSAAMALKEKNKVDPKNFADIYYFWGRCIKDLTRGKSGEEKHQLLLAEEDKYKRALEADPSDSYVAYSWAINLRFQLEYANTEAQALELYRSSQRMYKVALKNGYAEKYIKWGLGSLKLHIARKQLQSGNIESAAMFLDKSEKKYGELNLLWQDEHDHDVLTKFSLLFNYACIYVTRAKIHQESGNMTEARILGSMCKDRLMECAHGDLKQYLTLDLLDLWYFDDIRGEKWFLDIYNESQPKKLNAPY